MLNKLGIQANEGQVLDVGGFDGYWLSQQPSKAKTCLDISPRAKYNSVNYVKADALILPFANNTYDLVFSFDVLEHVPDDKLFVKELYRVTKPGGQIIISTPNKNITIFPPFLTNWVSRKWGHYRTKGYSKAELVDLMPNSNHIEFIYLREAAYRFLYLLLRFLWAISPKITKPIVRAVVLLDAKFLNGERGHILVSIRKAKHAAT